MNLPRRQRHTLKSLNCDKIFVVVASRDRDVETQQMWNSAAYKSLPEALLCAKRLQGFADSLCLEDSITSTPSKTYYDLSELEVILEDHGKQPIRYYVQELNIE